MRQEIRRLTASSQSYLASHVLFQTKPFFLSAKDKGIKDGFIANVDTTS